MLNKKLQIDQWNEMSYQLLKLITKQLKNPGNGRIVGIKRLLEVAAAKNTIHSKHYSPPEIVVLEKEWKQRDLKKGSAWHLVIKTAGTGSLPEGLCQLKKLLQMPYSTSSTNSEVSNDSNCCSSYLECVKDLKEQNEQLVKDLRTTRISVVSYKTGLESIEARLLVFKKNESMYEEDIKLLKREIYLRDLDIIELKRKLELATKEKDEVQLTVQKFENSLKNLSKLLDREIMDKCKIGLDDFVDVNESVSKSVVKKPTIETNKPKTARKENGAPIIEDWVSDSDEEYVPKVKTVEMFNKPSFAKINFVMST
ncbi:hypothetical protein Tco_0775911 [Tanacetum coccineum]